MHRVLSSLLAVTLLFGSTTPLAAQASLTENDIQRLQLAISDARADVDRLGSSNDTLSDDLRKELDNLSDEAIYLKVRMRKEHNIPRADYLDLRDRIDDVRVRASSDRTARPVNSSGMRSSCSAPMHVGTTGLPARWKPAGRSSNTFRH